MQKKPANYDLYAFRRANMPKWSGESNDLKDVLGEQKFFSDSLPLVNKSSSVQIMALWGTDSWHIHASPSHIGLNLYSVEFDWECSLQSCLKLLCIGEWICMSHIYFLWDDAIYSIWATSEKALVCNFGTHVPRKTAENISVLLSAVDFSHGWLTVVRGTFHLRCSWKFILIK